MQSNANYAEEIRTIALVRHRLFIGGVMDGLLDPSTAAKGGRELKTAELESPGLSRFILKGPLSGGADIR